MHEYDVALKLLLQASKDSILRQITGVSVARWLNAEMPQVQTSRADLLGATADGKLVHVELQSSNDPQMVLRMAEYGLRIYRQFGKFPKQIVLYVGEARLNMTASWREPNSIKPDFAFRYTLIRMANRLSSMWVLASSAAGSRPRMLTRLHDRAAIVREILSRIATLDEPARRDAFARFLVISGLRRLAPAIKEKAQKMPILNDIMNHEVIGPAIRQGRQEILRRQLETRFGELPNWVVTRLAALSAPELDEMAVRVLDAPGLENLFPGGPA